jgi:hypothetical protein
VKNFPAKVLPARNRVFLSLTIAEFVGHVLPFPAFGVTHSQFLSLCSNAEPSKRTACLAARKVA